MDEEGRPARYTNNELALLIGGLTEKFDAFTASVAGRLDTFVLKEVYAGDQRQLHEAQANVHAEVADAKSLARYCLTGVITLIAAVATLAVLVVTR